MNFFFFFFNDTATTEIYTLSLHDALPILEKVELNSPFWQLEPGQVIDPALKRPIDDLSRLDRKSTRLNSSHQIISYAVFCLKKKKQYSVLHPHGHHIYTNSLTPLFNGNL